MNLVYGEIVGILCQEGMRMARVRIAGALRKVPLELLASVSCGDKVLVYDGVAISKVEETTKGGGEQ
jgi:hydrogenase maturation factor